MNGSGKKLTRAASVSRLVVAATTVLAVALAVMPALSATASPDAAHGRAAMPKTTRPREFSVLNAVSCASPASCVSVGYSLGPRSYVQLAAQWDGAAWTQLPTPTAAALVPGMTAVSCASGSMCMAINGGALQEWNGASWQPQNATGRFAAVSCVSTVSCVAVGTGAPSPSLAAAVWNGQSWTQDDPVVPQGAGNASLDGISCVSASDCVAVGSYSVFLGGNDAPLAEQWNGQSWSQLSVPVPSGTILELNLTSVSCTGSDSCVAAGVVDFNVDASADIEGLAYAWDGTSWTALPQPAGIPASVSCWSASGCVTTDQVGLGAGGTAIPELWNGSSWAQLQPSLPNTQFAGFNGVSCYGPSACLFVGAVGGSRPLAEFWANGQWRADRVVPRDGFAGAWCTGPITCIAVGGYIGANDDNATLAADSSGPSWQQVTTPAASGTLTDISCDSPQFCVAVGGQGPNDLPLAEKWNGASWQVLDTSFGNNNPGTQPIAVSCAGGHCLAIGRNDYSIHHAEWWNGASWRLINMPTPRPHLFAQVSDVSCASTTFCLVAGTFHNRKGPFTSFADLWNGARFTQLRVPGNGLTSISCLSVRFCLGVTANSAVTWNGSSWRVRRLPGIFGRPGLSAVSCASARLCMAVGNFASAEGPRGNTIAFLTGTTWRILPSLPPDAVLTDVSCNRGRFVGCWAVGESYDGASATQTFAASWTGRDWLIYPTPNP